MYMQNRSALFFVCLMVWTGVKAVAAPVPEVVKQSWTYKTVGDLEIKADVFRLDDDRVRPIVIWIHGGALILGNREGIDRRIREPLLEAGYVLVSIDYRLAPETKLPEILNDLEDAYTWVHQQGPRLFRANTERVVVMGGSAGGYLTLTAGFRAKPRPAALVAFWGYGDLTGDWYSKPSPFYRQRPLVSREQAYRGVRGGPVTNGQKDGSDRGDYYLYCRQQGLWPLEVTGFDPEQESAAYDAFSPVLNVTGDYPPTLLIHGTEDTDVPYRQSQLMAEQFEKHGVEHRLITIPKAGHGIGDGDRELVEQAYREVMAFLEKHLPLE
ncbi:MAG: alpha/beta hydrolase [Planctomycetales bacterium]|nr:alpha/beta hydrolase [Planctomycetales bacterium]